MIHLCRFNDRGIARFEEFVHRAREQGDAPFGKLTDDPELTERLSARPVLEMRGFANRWEAARHFDAVFEAARIERDAIDDPKMWAWLSAVWVDELAPVKDGRRKLGEVARWVPQFGNYRRYYRHLLAGPHIIYSAHRDNPGCTRALLATSVDSPGELVAQCASRQEIVSNANLLEAITQLYFDSGSGKLKPGSGSKGSGGPRRLANDILPQFDLTWDFFGMQPERILALLPSEFDKFFREEAS